MADSGSALCLQCGLCCDGTLHAKTSVTSDEADAVRAVGLTVRQLDGKLTFSQPCAMYARPICRVYSARPVACRSYRCELLKAQERGAVSFETALAHVRRARALEQTALAALPAGETMASMQQAGREPRDGQWLLTWATLRRYLQRHFERPRAKS